MFEGIHVFFTAYIGWGLLLSLQPPFYPSEAEKKGATPSQYGFVFGIANLAAFIFAPIFGQCCQNIFSKNCQKLPKIGNLINFCAN